MIKTTIKVEGMMCCMCEAHVNDAVRGAFEIKKVTSSHINGDCLILSETPIDEIKVRELIEKTGYTTGEYTVTEEEKKGLFSFLKK